MIHILNHDSQLTELASMTFDEYSSEYCDMKEKVWNYAREILPAIFRLNIDISHKVPTNVVNYDRALKSTHANVDSLYPIAVRYINDQNVYVIERPPFKLSVDFKNARASWDTQKTQPLEIWIPWTVMILPLNGIAAGDSSNLKLFFNDGPIQSLSDNLVPVYLPNSYPDGRICWAGSFHALMSQLDTSNPHSMDINYIYSSILNDYLMGGWNTDLVFHYRLLQHGVDPFAADNGSPHILFNHVNDLVKSGDFPMLSLFIEPLKTNPDFANNLKSILENHYGITRRYGRAFVNGSILKDKNSGHCPKDIFLKLFAFMSSISLSDTLQFVAELKRLRYNVTTVQEAVDSSGCSSEDDNYHSLMAVTAPVTSAALAHGITTEYNTINAFVVHTRDYTVEERESFTYYLRRGESFERLLVYDALASGENDDSVYKFLYLEIYNLCKNRYNAEPEDQHKPFVIVIDGRTGNMSIHNHNYLTTVFSQILDILKEKCEREPNLRASVVVRKYMDLIVEIQK